MHRYLLIVCLLLLLPSSALPLHAAPYQDLFIANDATGRQLWNTNGTPQGTQVLRYLTTAPNGNSNSRLLGSAGQYGLFVAQSVDHKTSLWRTDGTPAGTIKIKDLGTLGSTDAAFDVDTREARSLADQLLFWTQTRNTLYLNRSNGSSEGTIVLASFPIGGTLMRNTMPPTLYIMGKVALFWAEDAQHGLELWRTDGSRQGTRLLRDATREGKPTAQDYYSGAYPPPAFLRADALYFVSPDQRAYHDKQAVAHTLWRTDGTTVTPLEHLGQLRPDSLMAIDTDTIGLFTHDLQNEHFEFWLWKAHASPVKPSAQTSQGQLTRLISEPSSTSSIQSLNYSTALWDKGVLYILLTTLDQNDTAELWRSDLTTQGTYRLLKLPNPNPEYKTPPELIAFAGGVYVFTYDGARPAGVWRTEGTPASTKPLLQLPGGQYAGGLGDAWTKPQRWNDCLIFPTFAKRGREYSVIWSINQQHPERVMRLAELDDPELLPPNTALSPQPPLQFLSGHQRWQTDGTPAGTKPLGQDTVRKHWVHDPWNAWNSHRPQSLPGQPDRWLQVVADPKAGEEVWVLNRQPTQSYLLKDIYTGPASSDVSDLNQTTDGWYFRSGQHWYFTNGEAQTIQPVTGVPASETLTTNAYPVAVQGNRLYFLTENQQTITLWQTYNGKAQQIRRFQGGYVWLFPSSQGVYAAQFHPMDYATQTTSEWELSRWDAAQQQWQGQLDSTLAKHTNLQQVLETEQGLFLRLNKLSIPPDQAVENEALWWQARQGQPWQVLKEGFATSALISDILQTTGQQVYLSIQAPDQTPNQRPALQLFRFDQTSRSLSVVNGLNLPEHSRLVAAPQGLFVLNKENERDHLWYLPDAQPRPRLLKRFATDELVSVGSALRGRIYLNVGKGDRKAVWHSDGSPEGTRELRAGISMY